MITVIFALGMLSFQEFGIHPCIMDLDLAIEIENEKIEVN